MMITKAGFMRDGSTEDLCFVGVIHNSGQSEKLTISEAKILYEKLDRWAHCDSKHRRPASLLAGAIRDYSTTQLAIEEADFFGSK